jgi:cytosine/adenosine deaminase-related metal-dependent hydrolase
VKHQVDLLVSGGIVVTMDPARRVLDDGAVAVDRGHIVAVGPAAEVESSVVPKRRLDARRKILLPGLIDAHAHAGHTLFKTLGAHLPSREWLRITGEAYFHATTPKSWSADGRLAALERVRFGITTGVMMLGNEPRTDDPVYGQAFARASASVGGRTIVSVGPASPPWPRRFTRWEDSDARPREVRYEESLGVTEELVRTLHGADGGRTRVMVGPSYLSVPVSRTISTDPSLAGVAAATARDMRTLADRYGVFIHTHAYGRELEYAEEHFEGYLGPDVLLAHCTGLTEREIAILAERDVKVAHCAKAHRAYTERCPVPELVDAGVTVAVTSDASAPDRTFDLFETMRSAQRLQRVYFRNASVLPPGTMLESVTIGAARAVGIEAEVGSLEPGKRADLVLVDTWRPHMVPALAPIWQLVMGAVGHDVTHVFVDGAPIVQEGRCVTVDEDEVLREAEDEARHMVERAGLEYLSVLGSGFWGSSGLAGAH